MHTQMHTRVHTPVITPFISFGQNPMFNYLPERDHAIEIRMRFKWLQTQERRWRFPFARMLRCGCGLGVSPRGSCDEHQSSVIVMRWWELSEMIWSQGCYLQKGFLYFLWGH